MGNWAPASSRLSTVREENDGKLADCCSGIVVQICCICDEFSKEMQVLYKEINEGNIT